MKDNQSFEAYDIKISVPDSIINCNAIIKTTSVFPTKNITKIQEPDVEYSTKNSYATLVTISGGIIGGLLFGGHSWLVYALYGGLVGSFIGLEIGTAIEKSEEIEIIYRFENKSP